MPARSTLAVPSGSTSSPSGTSPLSGYSSFASKNITGSGSRIAAANNPFTSAGVDGATTFKPGTAMAQFSTACECCAPKRRPPPLAVRTTSGSEIWPPRHVARLRHLVGRNVPAHGEEIGEHDLGDRPQTGHRRTHRGAEDRHLRDRRVAHARRTEAFEQADGGFEHAARAADVLAEEHDVLVAFHLLRDRRPRPLRDTSVPPCRGPVGPDVGVDLVEPPAAVRSSLLRSHDRSRSCAAASMPSSAAASTPSREQAARDTAGIGSRSSHFGDLVVGPVVRRIGARVAAVAIGQRLDQRRARHRGARVRRPSAPRDSTRRRRCRRSRSASRP